MTAKSRTGALWLSYITYVSIVLDFIRAEITFNQSNWQLHLDSTRKMLKLFVCTGHMNYAKTSCLYLQTA